MSDADEERHGLFQLYPSKGKAKEESDCVDIVAIHGLGGDAFRTWTDKDGHLWLRDSLPKHVPNSRVMTYGYDSAFMLSRSRSLVGDYAIELLYRLHAARLSHQDRPLLFVCHSLGGVVFKQAIITASEQHSLYGRLLDSIHGVVFMGTPHRGSRTASPAHHLSRIINAPFLGGAIRSELLKMLQVSSETLVRISNQSVSLMKDLSIVSFYEQKPLGVSLIVEPFSAILGLPNERAIPMNADHREMVRVSPRKPHRYMPVWSTISMMVEECLSKSNIQTLDLLDKLYCLDYKQLRLRPVQPHPGTSEWLYEDPIFKTWCFSSRSAMLWLLGSPGLGKSVLARSLTEDVMAKSPVSPLPECATVAHFFCTYSDASFNSEDILLRSLLHQILQAHPKFHNTISSRLEIRNPHGVKYRLATPDLWSALKDVLALNAMADAWIVVDAIDELPKLSAIAVLDGFNNILSNLNATHARHRVKVFVTSRHIPEYNRSSTEMLVLRLQHHHFIKSIEKYVTDKVSEFVETNSQFNAATDLRVRGNISKRIARGADGMFLWAEVAWKSFRQGLIWTADTINEKLNELDEIPPGLNSLYDTLLDRVDSSIRKDMWTIFSIIGAVQEPLTPTELGVLIGMYHSTKQLVVSTDISVVQNIEEIIEANFPDLIRIGDDGRVKFVHLSFKEYLDRHWAEKNPETLEKAQRSITKSCLEYLELKDLIERAHELTPVYNIMEEFDLFRYSLKYFLVHLSRISYDDNLWLTFAKMGHRGSIFTWGRRYVEEMVFSKSGTRYRDELGTPLLHVVRHFQSEKLVRRFSSHDYDLNEPWKNEECYSALYYCCWWASPGSVELRLALLLLELGADANDCHPYSKLTCLHWAIRLNHWQLFREILKYPGLKINSQDLQGRSALHFLIDYGDLRRISHFLDHTDCNVNVQDSMGQTPLHQATNSVKLDMMERLLNDPRVRLDITDNQGRTALTIAAYWGHKKAALLIIQSTTAFPTPENNELSSLISSAIHGQKDVVRILVAKYSNLNAHMDLSGKGILHHSAMNDWPDILEKCLSEGPESININQIDHSGATALHYAAAMGNVGSIKKLLQYGAGVRFQDRNGRTAAHAAADAGFKDALALLLEVDGLDVNQTDNLGRNLVHWAASCDWVDVVKTVLQRPGADLLRKDRYGKTPRDIAFICSCPNVGEYLDREMTERGICTRRLNYYNWESLRDYSVVEPSEGNGYETRESSLGPFAQSGGGSLERAMIRRWYPEERWGLTRLNEAVQRLRTFISRLVDVDQPHDAEWWAGGDLPVDEWNRAEREKLKVEARRIYLDRIEQLLREKQHGDYYSFEERVVRDFEVFERHLVEGGRTVFPLTEQSQQEFRDMVGVLRQDVDEAVKRYRDNSRAKTKQEEKGRASSERERGRGFASLPERLRRRLGGTSRPS